MKNVLLACIVLLCLSKIGKAQSVYGCDMINPDVTLTEINNAGYEFYKPCINMPGWESFWFTNSTHKKITASSEIHIDTSFIGGTFNQYGELWLKIEEPIYDVALISDHYTDLNSIEKFKKVEFGIEITGELLQSIQKFLDPNLPTQVSPLNPFIDREILVESVFTHSGSGLVKKRQGFYNQEYVVNNSSAVNDWEIPTTNPYPFRIRFAPPNEGIWDAEIVVKYYDELTQSMNEISLPKFSFNVIDNNHPGYVKVHDNKRNLVRGNRIILPTAHVFPGPYNATQIWGVQPSRTNKAAEVDDWQRFHENLKNYIDSGGRYIKTAQTAYSSLLEFENKGNYLNRLHYAYEQDRIIDTCEKYDVLIDFNLLFQDVFMTFGQDAVAGAPHAWDYGPYDENGQILNPNYYPNYCYYNPTLTPLPKDMFLQDESMYYHKQRNRYYIARYGYSPQIYTFELMSEPWHVNQYPNYAPASDNYGIETIEVINSIENYHNSVANYIKDSLGHQEHLITGIEFYEEGFQDDFFYSQTAQNDNIDILGISYYSKRPDKLIIDKNNSPFQSNQNLSIGNAESSVYKEIREIHDSYGKPVIFSEAGHNLLDCGEKYPHIIDVMTLGFTGAAAINMWDGYRYHEPGNGSFVDTSKFDSRLLWRHTIRAQNHYNSDGFIGALSTYNGNWIQGRQSERLNAMGNEDAFQMQYFIDNYKQRVAGYVQNITFNSSTKAVNSDCIQNTLSSPLDQLHMVKWHQTQNTIWVEGLLPHFKYSIDWYYYETGDYSHTSCFKAKNGGKLMLKFPELSVNATNPYPIYWFVMTEDQGCSLSNQINTSSNSELQLDREIEDSTWILLDSNQLASQVNKVWPNPASRILNIELSEQQTIRMYSIIGDLVMEKQLESGISMIDVSQLDPGIYFLVNLDLTIHIKLSIR